MHQNDIARTTMRLKSRKMAIPKMCKESTKGKLNYSLDEKTFSI